MKIIPLLFASLICFQLTACHKNEEGQSVNTIEVNINPASPSTSDTNTNNKKMKITIGTHVFTATFNESATATAFKAKLPLTINMTDLNRNEKFFDLAFSLPTNVSNPETIQNGDLMMYGANTLVLFYKTFSTSYRYTKLGQIDNPLGLDVALGAGNITVSFELIKN
jgi:hypothetical protein